MWENLTVNGFHFDSAAEYAEAKHEAETLDYICSRMDINNPEVAYKVYCKLLERNNLHTIIGISFLKEIRDRVITSGFADEETLKSIHAPFLKFTEIKGDTGDEDALEQDSVTSEEASDVGESIPEEDDDNPDELRRLNRDIGMYRDREKKLSKELEQTKVKCMRFGVIIIALAIIAGALLGLSIYNNGLNMTDKEIAIQDKYSAWEEELSAREKALEEYEVQLNKNAE